MVSEAQPTVHCLHLLGSTHDVSASSLWPGSKAEHHTSISMYRKYPYLSIWRTGCREKRNTGNIWGMMHFSIGLLPSTMHQHLLLTTSNNAIILQINKVINQLWPFGQSLPDKHSSQQLSPQYMVVPFPIQTTIFTDPDSCAYVMAHKLFSSVVCSVRARNSVKSQVKFWIQLYFVVMIDNHKIGLIRAMEIIWQNLSEKERYHNGNFKELYFGKVA